MEKFEEFEKLKTKVRKHYDSIESVRCPALGNAKVHFTADGFHHLQFKRRKTERTKTEQEQKLRFLKDGINIVAKATTYQEYEIRRLEMPVKRRGKTKREITDVFFWGLVAMLNEKQKVKVVIRRVGNGQYHFWSIMPFWNIGKVAGHKVSSTAKGNLQED